MNKNSWNNFPEVTPPLNVWMQVEWLPLDGNTYRYVGKYIEEDGEFYWVDANDDDIEVTRFRPWDNEKCEPKVVLTIEEAKEIHDMLADNENYMPEGLWDMGHWLKNKIEQAEKKNG